MLFEPYLSFRRLLHFAGWALLLLCVVVVCPAQISSNELPGPLLDGMTRRVWRMQDGLPEHVIDAMVETSDHYLWLGTPRSLIRFDGFHFVDMSGKIAPAIRDFGVTCLFVSRDGSLWIGTGNARLLQVKNGVVRTYGAKEGLGGYNVMALQQDATGAMWAGTDHGIYRLTQGLFQRIRHIGDPSAHAMISDGDGGLWIGGHHLIHFADGRFQRVALPKEALSVRIEALVRTSDGMLWIGTLGGLFRMNTRGLISPRPVLTHEVKALRVDQDHRLWVGTLDDGLFLRTAGDTFIHVADVTAGLSSTVLALFADNNNDIWLGTESGLVRLSDTGMRLIAVPAARHAERISVMRDSDGSLWVCADTAIHVVNGTPHTVNFPLAGRAPVRAMLRDAGGALWVGTGGEGAIRIPRRGKPRQFSPELGTSYITGFLQGKNGDVWIATESGIAVWRKGDVISFQSTPGAPHQPVLSLAPAEPDGVWIGTSHGLFRLRDGRYVEDPANSALGDHAVRALLHGSDGALWIGTESGLFRWKDHKMIKVPLEEDGGSRSVLSILEDKRNRLWFGGPDRVLRISTATIDRVLAEREARVIAGRDEAAGNEEDVVVPEIYAVVKETGAALYGGMPSCSAADGRSGAWFVSDAGLIHISGSTIPRERAPKVVLQKVLVDGKGVAVPKNATLSLPPSTKTLEIEAVPVVLGSHAGLLIRRKLIGFDRNWSRLSGSHVATYTNLPPGDYIYRVEAGWHNGRATSIADLKVIQRAHFYRQWWFLALCIALVGFVAWWLHWQRVRRLSAQFQAVAEERNRVAREMHDTILQGCIGISFLLDGIASHQGAHSARSNASPTLSDRTWAALEMARAEIERTIYEARTAIWNLRRTEPETNMNHALREMFDTMTSSLSTPATLQISGPELRVPPEMQRELLMAVREALQNSIRHADAAQIVVSLCYTSDQVRIDISDRGRGIRQTAKAAQGDKHFGILGMRERMARIGGACRITSVADGGTVVTLELPVGAPRESEKMSR